MYAITLAVVERHKSLQHTGAWPMELYSTLVSTLKRKRSLDLITMHEALWFLQSLPEALQFREPISVPMPISVECIQETKKMAVNDG